VDDEETWPEDRGARRVSAAEATLTRSMGGADGIGDAGDRFGPAVGSLLVEVAAAQVLGGFAGAAIPAVVLKGHTLAHWLDDNKRLTTDLDVLVPLDRVAAAESVLASLGYRGLVLNFAEGDRPHHARIWESPTGGVDVDLHWTLVGVAADDPWRALERHTVAFEFGGFSTRALDDAGQALQVALHAAQHGRQGASELDDLERALRTKGLDVWRAAADLAAEVDAVPAFVTGLRLAAGGVEVTAQLGLTHTPTVETELRSAAELPHTALGFAWLASRESRGRRLRFLFRKIVPPRAVVRSWASLRLPVEPRGPGLVLAYAWRVLWLAGHAPGGLLAWLRARRRARS
jgi:hypothetical protein